jgi:hypothetical protein
MIGGIMQPVNRLEHEDVLADLVPTTSIDHLLSEEERQHAREDRDAVEALGREMERRETLPTVYSKIYEAARRMLAAGFSPKKIRAEMRPLTDSAPDQEWASITRDAYEDALAGRPRRLEAGGSA